MDIRIAGTALTVGGKGGFNVWDNGSFCYLFHWSSEKFQLCRITIEENPLNEVKVGSAYVR